MGIEWLRVAAFYGQPDDHVFLGLALGKSASMKRASDTHLNEVLA
jgi:hypothetical protein